MVQPGICSAQQAWGTRNSHRTDSFGAVSHCPFILQIRAFLCLCDLPYPSPVSSSSCCHKQEAGKTGKCRIRVTGLQGHSSRAITMGMWCSPHPIALFKQEEGSFLGYPVPPGAHCSVGMAVPGTQLPRSQAGGEQEPWRGFCGD